VYQLSCKDDRRKLIGRKEEGEARETTTGVRKEDHARKKSQAIGFSNAKSGVVKKEARRGKPQLKGIATPDWGGE